MRLIITTTFGTSDSMKVNWINIQNKLDKVMIETDVHDQKFIKKIDIKQIIVEP